MSSSSSQPAAPPAATPPPDENDYNSEDADDNPKQLSGFERFKDETQFEKLTDLLSKIEQAFQSFAVAAAATANGGGNITATNPNTVTAPTTTTTTTNETSNSTNGDNIVLLKQVEMLREDVNYIKKYIESLNSSKNSDRVDELLQHLMEAADRSEDDFQLGSHNFKQLLHIVAKLKLWVPRQQASNSGSLETAKEEEEEKKKKKKKESPYTSSKQKEKAAAGIVKKLVSLKIPEWGMAGLLRSYESLTVNQKLCLLCFSVFPCDVEKDKKNGILIEKSLVIKKKILIYWWVGEGFIGLDREEDVARADANSTDDPDPNMLNPKQSPGPTANPNMNPSSNPMQDQIQEENPNPNSSPSVDPIVDPNPSPGSNLNPEENKKPDPNPHKTMATDTDTGRNKATQVSQQVSAAQRGKKKTIEEIGEQILKVLTQKGFIEPVMQKGRESGSCSMHPFVHSFVAALAKRAGFFDFSNENGKLIPRFTHSQRACLVKKSQDSVHSSCQLWAKYTDSRDKLKRFETVQTLFNVNESIIDIKPEWFSKMKYLSVLHLGSWHSGTAEHIEVEDQKFLEDLENLDQLKLFSLQGVSTIMKLPDSVCKLTNLIILDLKECHNLEELPPDIGSLKNLTHLDITNCHLLTKLPKGISLLSKLEVLRGFVINDQASDPRDEKACILSRWWKKTKRCVIHDLFCRENKEICTLRDLLKLEKLRELSIVANRDNFPNSEELQVFKEMENLRKLRISWERSFKDDNKNLNGGQTDTNQGENIAPEESSKTCGWWALCKKPGSRNSPREVVPGAQHAPGQEASPASKSLELMKCCKQKSNQKDGEKKPTREFLDQIQKLELWCFPLETAPDWLDPDQLKNLQKLYIKGGKLKKLPGGTNGNKWKVTTLRLKYLPDLAITWTELKAKFPNLTYLEKYECNRLSLFPCDEEGVWKNENELPGDSKMLEC